MSDPRSHETKPPVIFRKTVHPEPSLPPIDLNQTSLVGRVVEEVLSILFTFMCMQGQTLARPLST
jgi:hypothetical protein